MFIGVEKGLPFEAEPCSFTFLRDPVARCVSEYNYLKFSKTFTEIADNNWSLLEWYYKSPDTRKNNGMVRHLLVGAHADLPREAILSRNHLDEAKEILSRYWFVGLHESFDDDSRFLFGTIGLRHFRHDAIINASREPIEVTEAIRDRLQEENLLDQELWEWAQRQREAWVAAHQQEYWSAVARAERAKTLDRQWVRARKACRLAGEAVRRAWPQARPCPETSEE